MRTERHVFMEDGDFVQSPASPSISGNSAMAPMGEVQSMEFESDGECCDDNELTEEELQLAKRFVDLMGSPDRAREAVEKVLECEDCMGILDDDEDDEGGIIGAIAHAMPDDPGLPTQNPIDISAIYNGSAINR